MQAAYLRDIQARFPFPVIEIPLLPDAIWGMDALEALMDGEVVTGGGKLSIPVIRRLTAISNYLSNRSRSYAVKVVRAPGNCYNNML